ncbi:MAG: TIGR02281 family clan AA aspartic protease [Alphaproteobacteria bacterium]|nr:TIGR02281 family clan AA aspartic protease [Alphaproteobacteria bacterium]
MNDPDRPSPWGRRPDTPSENPERPTGQPHFPYSRRSRFSVFVIGIIIFLLIGVIAFWVMPRLLPSGLTTGDNMTGVLYDGLLLAFVGAGLWVHVRSAPGLALRHLATWVIIFGVIALGYSIWTGAGRLGGELNPAKGISENGSISFRANMSGHFFVQARVNGVPIVFMVDTGATDVALTRKDARAIGLPVNRLNYTMPYKTANGVAYGAPVRIKNITLGPISKNNITGSVVPKGLDYSLLGMSFLNNIRGYKVVDGVLTLYP